jgi:hypothetical protein
MFTNWCLLSSCDWQSEFPDAHPCPETGIMTVGFYGFSSVALGKYRDIKFGRGRFPPRSSRFIIHYLLSVRCCVIWHKWKRRQINRWCTQLTVVYVIKQYNLHNGLIPPHRFLHVSGQPATVTNEDELPYIYIYSRSEVAAWGRWVAAGTESRAGAFRSHPLSVGPRDQGALALA